MLIFMVSLSLKLYKGLGTKQCTLKLTFNDGFMHPIKEIISPLFLCINWTHSLQKNSVNYDGYFGL